MLMDNIFVRALSRVGDLILLNILWLICSVPIITAGAAVTALYSVMLKIVANEEGYIVRDFMTAFKRDFKQSTIVWLILIVTGVIMGIDFRVMHNLPENIARFGTVLLGAVVCIYMVELIFVFPLIARFENSTVDMMKNAVLIPAARLPYMVMVLLLTGACLVLTILNRATIMAGAVVWSLIGVAMLTFANSFFIQKMFKPFTEIEQK